MKVKWVPQAKKEMRLVAKYINKEFGKKAKDDFIQDVRDASRLIGATPNVGQAESLLADRADMYRSYVVNRLNKIVYRIVDDHIEIADFWDVRRDPSTLADQVK
jgi:plasmid stabilization system protein ParE